MTLHLQDKGRLLAEDGSLYKDVSASLPPKKPIKIFY